MLSPKTRRNILRIIPFGLIWFLSGLVFLVVERAAIGDADAPASAIEMNVEVFIFSSLAITCVGLLVGAIELFYLERVFAKQSFTRKLLYKIFVYIFLLFIVTLITFPIAASLELRTHLSDPKVWDKLLMYLTSLTHASTVLQLSAALGASLFYSAISEHIGQGILMNFFTGKYHSPTVEHRIFMFSDMRASTTIAESLGHVRYFELLREYYSDLSDAIIRHSGEIYQYVGDEIVITWKYEAGVQDNNCINCFFAMKKDLAKRTAWYKSTFGVTPAFKAGLHAGQVTTGEIGALKKEIIFTGDAVNATARIQSLCNHYGVDVLISGDLLKGLSLDSQFAVRTLGSTSLRGKSESVELYTVTVNEGVDLKGN